MKRKQLLAGLMAMAVILTSAVPAPSVQAKNKEKAVGTTYYVSTVRGNDNNDGLSEGKAFYSLDKINDITLQPGDQVLLECGSVFEDGFLHIKGSGSEEAPIVIDNYGEGNLPVISTNGEGVWYQDYGKRLDSTGHKYKGYVSSSILLYDVEYIEIKNLEITNEAPKIEATYNALDVMNRTGVAGVAKDKGTLDHIYLDNLYIHDVIGNVYDKHMNNGGIYFTVFEPENEAETGIAKYDDVKIENCYVDYVNRWGIAVGYTYNWDKFKTAALSDETVAKYGSTNVEIRNNYVKDAGGDAITVMYCDRPLIEYNVSDGVARQINTTDYSQTGSGRVAAAIWPWKCKDAVFQYNEAFDTCQNQDGQAWDADYGDGTLYQYNYSHNNGGGSVMFCGVQAVNNIFRYNISQNDLGGVINPAGQPDAHVYNNTFYVKEGIDFIRTNMGGGPMVVENNIIYYSGEEAKTENWFKHTNANATIYDNNIYYNYANTPTNDANAITEDPKLMNPGSAPTAAAKITAGEITESIVHERTAFEGYMLADDSPAIAAGKEIENNGGKDFFGNPIKGTVDIGAVESDSEKVIASNDNEIKSAFYMVKDHTMYIPVLENNATSVKEVKEGISVHEAATVKVLDNGSEVTNGNIKAGMQVVIVAENGDENTYTIEAKNTYQWALDYAGPQQGNVWFAQVKYPGKDYENIKTYDSQWPNWVVDTYYGAGVDLPNHSTPSDENTHGLLMDTTTSETDGMSMAFRAPKSGKITIAVKDDEPYLRQSPNSGGSVILSFTKNGEVIGDTYELVTSLEKAEVGVREIEVEKGDWIRVEANNKNRPSKPSLHITPIVTYVDEAIVDPEPVETDKEDLAALIKYAKDAQEAPSYAYLVPKVKALFEKALADAVAVNTDAAATQAEVDAAYDALLAKVHLLDFTGNAETLQSVVSVANGKVESAYTKESWAPFKAALEAAQKVLDDVNALQAEIDAARDELQAKMDALVKITVNKDKLAKLVADAAKYEAEITKYTKDTAAAFTAALEGARDVLETAEVQDEVNAAYSSLLSAIFGLRETPNKDKLEELLGKVKAMDLSVYSEGCANAVKAAYAKAKAVFEDENADQKEVDAAVAALEKVVKAANAEAGDNASGNGSVSDEKDETSDKVASDNAGSKQTTGKTDKKAGNTAAKTGDSANAAIPAAAGLAAVLAAIMSWKKKID